MNSSNITKSTLQSLAKSGSKTLVGLIERKKLDIEKIENVNDKYYLRSSCEALSLIYIQALDADEIKFNCSDDQENFVWLLGIITDISCGGRMEDLIKPVPPKLTIVKPVITEKILP